MKSFQLTNRLPNYPMLAVVCAALLTVPAMAAPPAVKSLSVLNGQATLSGQQPLAVQVVLEAPAREDMKVVLRLDSTDRPLATLPSAVVVSKGQDRSTFPLSRLPAAFAVSTHQTVTIAALAEGQRAPATLPVTIRGGLPDTPEACDLPQAYRLHVQGSGSEPAPGRQFGSTMPPMAIAVSGETYSVTVTLDCAVRSVYSMPLVLQVNGISTDPLLSAAERLAGANAAFAGFPSSLVVPANQRAATVTLTAGDTLLGGIGKIQGATTLVAVRSAQASDTLRIKPHPRCLHTFTLKAPATVTAGASLRPMISRPCISPEVNNASGQYQFAFESSDAIALPVPLTPQLIRGIEYNDQRAVRTLSAGQVSAPIRVELRVVKVSGPELAAPIAPVSIMVTPR